MAKVVTGTRLKVTLYLTLLLVCVVAKFGFFCIRNRRERDHWGDLGVDGWIILGWISRRWDVGMWTRLGRIFLRNVGPHLSDCGVTVNASACSSTRSHEWSISLCLSNANLQLFVHSRFYIQIRRKGEASVFRCVHIAFTKSVC